MPRQSIVPSAKDIISFDVNITQTTEEQIWENLKNKLATKMRQVVRNY